MTARTIIAAAMALVLVLASCGDDDQSSSSTATSSDTVSGAARTTDQSVNLRGVCPDKVVVQTDWFPESEHGATFELLGPGYKASKASGAVTGPLVFEGKDTGVSLEIRG